VATLVGCLATPVVGTAAARGATVRSGVASDCEEYAGEPCRLWTRVVYRADPGEQNLVTVREGDGTVVIRDRGAALQAFGPCTPLGAHAVACALHGPTPDGVGAADWESASVRVHTGDGDDRLFVSRHRSGVDMGVGLSSLGPGDDVASVGKPSLVRGGTGDDRLTLRTGSREWGMLSGGAGNDVLVGTRATETVGGTGDDVVTSLGPLTSCGPGRDTVRVPGSYGLDTALQAPAPSDCEQARFADLARIEARPQVSSSRLVVRLLGGPAPGQNLGWEIRAGWRRGGALLGRARTRGLPQLVTIALNGRGRACVARSECRASLTVTQGASRRSAPLPLLLRLSSRGTPSRRRPR
jgi:hypothetical protein